jgi:hypothetical protein
MDERRECQHHQQHRADHEAHAASPQRGVHQQPVGVRMQCRKPIFLLWALGARGVPCTLPTKLEYLILNHHSTCRISASSIEHHDGEVVFRHACKMGLVSKRKDSHYRSGRSPDWRKMKNPSAPAVKREEEEACGKQRWRRVGDVWRQIIIASNPTAAIPTTKKANAAASYSSQYLCTRMKIILHRGMGEHQLSMDNSTDSQFAVAAEPHKEF